jgi:hypothetical protein
MAMATNRASLHIRDTDLFVLKIVYKKVYDSFAVRLIHEI